MEDRLDDDNSTGLARSRLDDLNGSQPWDRLPGEPAGDYELFVKFMLMGPQRSMRKMWRDELVAQGELLPGEPLNHVPSRMIRVRAQWDWMNRVAAWDQRNWDLVIGAKEETLAKRIEDMVEEHLEGLREWRRAAIMGLYERDDQGNIIMDADGMPRIKVPDDQNLAWRIFRQSIDAERTASGIPTNISVMTNRQLEARISEIRIQLESHGFLEGNNDGDRDDDGDDDSDDDIIEGEFTGGED